MAIKNITLDAAYTTIFASTSSSAVTTIYICNKTVDVATFSLHVMPEGDVASANNMIYYNIPVAPSDTYVLDTEKLILEIGESIVGVASVADALVVTLSYVGI